MNQAREVRKFQKAQDKLWAIGVKNRDSNQCIICSSTKLLNAHHLFPREIKYLRLDIDNGCCLCPTHHKYSLEISAHRNPLAFLIWLVHNREEQLRRLFTKYKEPKI